MTQLERGKNLIIVAALDRYADEHGISNQEAYALFREYDLFTVLRDNYETLHTQGLFEGAAFAHDYIERHAG
jgi:hypothetical protein